MGTYFLQYNGIMNKIIDTTNPDYKAYCKIFFPSGEGIHNGAYYYSKEIVENIIPLVKTDRPWDTLGMRCARSMDCAIVFIHHNLRHDEVYGWLKRYNDLVYVCSSEASYEWAKQQSNGHAIFLPLSIDTKYVKQFKTKKTKQACYAGNRWAFKTEDIDKYVPKDTDFIKPNTPRDELLAWMAEYKECYAIGRTALEALALGCKLKVCDSRYPDVKYWKLLDNKKAAKMLQKELDRIDGVSAA